ncbi:WD40 repeat-like protein [Westerdykella ornata]|uniref:WD40 repeat-like protein n=1 Tax=Westerdykella ornata TaxID=318751 RepID=A0A6A6JL50_WESOR|nr:WD40 repeat-like protein [Westerdykella ornata]KAF2275629.1 WD40 repeat-like protein [Westerdykella ornata]
MSSHVDPFRLRATHQLSAKLTRGHVHPSVVQRLGPITWYDVKFYPHNGRGSSQVFAVTGGSLVAICRCVVELGGDIEVIRLFEDEGIKEGNEAKAFNSLEWSRASNGDPLICVAGGDPRIKILSVKTGELVNTVTGHGDVGTAPHCAHWFLFPHHLTNIFQVVADLALSPANPSYLASASYDHTIRLWSLDPDHQTKPTATLLFGGGHDRQVLTVGWHQNGKYLLSGGMDTQLNLWTIPDTVNETLGTDHPARIYYPHFSSKEIHHDYIDCVRFYGDLILSRAAKDDKILLWRIDAFDSSKDPPAAPPLPPSQAVYSDETVYVAAAQVPRTRSAWGGKFQRLLQFHHPNAARFYIRFGLLQAPGMHPVLGVGNEKHRVSFWDLQKLESAGLGQDVVVVEKKKEKKEKSPPKAPPGTRYLTTGISDPLKSIVPHTTVQLQGPKFTIQQVAFSPDGRWCVAVGNEDMGAVFSRWEDGFPE